MANDSDPNVGVGTPIPGGGPGTGNFILYRPPVWTALSLAEYAEIIGINPIQFMSGDSTNYFPSTGCTDRWRQYAWQDEAKVSRDELAREIRQAELDIASTLGYYPGQVWTTGEKINYPRHYRRKWTTSSGLDVRGYYKSVKLKYGKFEAAGVRSVTFVSSASFSGGSMQFKDEDGDGFNEMVEITVGTSETDVSAHKVYFPGMNGDPLWEIRPATKKEISGGSLVITVPVWLLFDPDKLGAFPGPDGFTDLDPSVVSNFVSEVDVYYESVDVSTGNLFYWTESTQLVDDTDLTTQSVCVEGKLVDEGHVSVTPAEYSVAESTWSVQPFAVAREPDYVELSYLSGAYETDMRSGEKRVPSDLAKAIAWIATARLPRPLCTQCQNIKDKEKRLRTDYAMSASGETGDVRFVSIDVLRSPFGTKIGEYEAWMIIKDRIKDGDVAPRVAVF